MSSGSGAGTTSSSSSAGAGKNKSEWYHLDRVAIAKRICLDPLAVKLKTALNNNNNNVVSSGGGPSPSGNSNKNRTKTKSFNEQVQRQNQLHSRHFPNKVSVGGAGSKTDVNSKPGILSSLQRFSANKGGSTLLKSSIPPNFLQGAGGRQLAALQLKRRRKAARAAAAAAAHSQSSEPPQNKKDPPRDCVLDEEPLLINGGGVSVAKIGSGSCGSSSSSGVSSDFEEVDSGSTSSTMKGTSASPRGGGSGGCQSSSSSECEEDDEDAAKKKDSCSNNSKNISNGHNSSLTNLNILNSVSVMVESVGRSGGGSKVCKSASITVPSIARTINGKSAVGPSSVVLFNKTRTEVTVKDKIATATTATTISPPSSVVIISDTNVSFSDLDFIMMDKGKRRTDRYDSSESSDSGVATLSPSTSDSPELSTCCDFTPDHHLEVSNLISANRSSTATCSSSSSTSSSSSYPLKTSSSSSSSSCSSSSSGVCLNERQSEPGTVSTTTSASSSASASSTSSCLTSSACTNTTCVKNEASQPSSSSSTDSDNTCSSSSCSLLQTNPPVIQETLCQWKGCTCSTTEASHNILEHIQTLHVAPQMKTAGYVCLWEGCKVYNKRSSSLSWLERHVLSHSGNKPFKCIFPGCGLSFSSQTALERHVNSHIATNGTTQGAQGNSTVANKKIDASPAKSSRRKKARFRKQRVNIGQRVDYFDKRIMEVIKHWLASSVDQFAVNAHDCTFRSEILARRVLEQCERQVLVRWHPRFILPDEWMPESKVTLMKLVPLRQIPTDKIRLLYPSLFPPVRQEKATRKRKPRSNLPLRASSTSLGAHSERSSSLSTLLPSSSPPSSSSSDNIPLFIDATASETSSLSSRSTRSSSSSLLSIPSSCSFSIANLVQPSNKSLSSSSSSIGGLSLEQRSYSMKHREQSGIEQEEDKCHKKFCGSSPCDCPSVLVKQESDDLNEDNDYGDSNDGVSNDEDESEEESSFKKTLDSSHWALQVLYEDLGMLSS